MRSYDNVPRGDAMMAALAGFFGGWLLMMLVFGAGTALVVGPVVPYSIARIIIPVMVVTPFIISVVAYQIVLRRKA